MLENIFGRQPQISAVGDNMEAILLCVRAPVNPLNLLPVSRVHACLYALAELLVGELERATICVVNHDKLVDDELGVEE